MTNGKKKTKEYRFEDWLEGRLSNDDLVTYKAQHFFNKEHGWNNLLKESEKIREAQKNAFLWGKEMTVHSFNYFASIKYRDAKNPANWLRIEIDKIDKFIKDNPDLEQQWEQDRMHIADITAKRYLRVKDMYGNFTESAKEQTPFVGIDIKKGDKLIPSPLYDMYIKKEYLDYLNQMDKDRTIEQIEDLPPIDKIRIIEEIRTRDDVTYDKAIEIATKEYEQYFYKNYNSFKKARSEYRDYL